MARRRRHRSLLGLAQAGDMNPLWGAALSGSIGTGTAVGIRAFSGMDKQAELIGFGAGAAAGLALMASPKTRAAGVVGLVVALTTNGLRALEAFASCKQQVKDLTGMGVSAQEKAGVNCGTQLETAKLAAKAAGVLKGGLGAVSMERRGLAAAAAYRVPSLGDVSIERRRLAGAGGGGLGIVSPEVIRSLGAAGQTQLPTFQGNDSPPAQIVGAQGIGRHFGATIFG